MLTAASVETRVLVLRLENMIAIVCPRRDCERVGSKALDFAACLWVAALRTRVESSVGERSDIERRCRGAKGEVAGVDVVAEA